MSAVMMLNYFAETMDDADSHRVAERIKKAYDKALTDGQKTRDLGGQLSTDAFADAIIERL
jgi:isocitrate/isopropylmalate dehydrogenase